MVELSEIEAARERIASHVACTPCELSETLSAQLGGELYIKFENLQFTASFKERGALNCLLLAGESARDGVIAMSAGNHAQALAYHGRRLGLPTTIVMPRFTPNAKVEATRVHGAEVILEGATFDQTRAFTTELATERNLRLIHPFDDPAVIAGQGTVGLEIAEQVQDVDNVIVPVGGGGLISGVAVALKARKPEVNIIGVQMERFRGAHQMFHGEAPSPPELAVTVAEGIAVKEPGMLTSELIKQHVSDIKLVGEAQVEQAIFDLLEIEKTVVEGAGAAPLALLRAVPDLARDKRTVMILSGGNIDMMILSSVLQRGLVRMNRLVRLSVEIPDTPGALASLTEIVGGLNSNIREIEHNRAFAGSSVRATVVELELEMRGEEQQDNVVRALADAGYLVKVES